MKLLKSFVLSVAVLLATVGASPRAPLLAVPAKPSPQSPTGGKSVTTATPDLIWGSVSAADSYDVEIATDPGTDALGGFNTALDSANVTAPDHHYVVGVTLDYATVYYWHVRSNGPGGTSAWSGTVNFKVAVQPPTLVSPADGSGLDTPPDNTNRPTFTWTAVANATGYILQVAPSSLFSSLIINVNLSASTTEYTPTANLPANQILYWRVQALSTTYGSSAWATPFKIDRTANPPSVPVLLQPATGKQDNDFTPGLYWQKVTNPSATIFSAYHVQISRENPSSGNPTFDNCETSPGTDDCPVDDNTISTDIDEPEFIVPDADELLPATIYYWRVRAENHEGAKEYASDWSKPFKLITTVDRVDLTTFVPPDATELDNTTNNNIPTFTWDSVPKASGYNIQFFRDPTKNPFISTTVRTTSYTPSTALPAGITVYWRVRAINSIYGNGLWSLFSSVDTVNPPSTPRLIYPVGNALIPTVNTNLYWSISTVPVLGTWDHYQVQVATDSAFSVVVQDDSIANQINPLDPVTLPDTGLKYYWRVRACSEADECSPWSKTAVFRVRLDAPTGIADDGAYPLLLTWSPVVASSSVNYTVQVSTKDTFTSLIVNKNSPVPALVVTTHLTSGKTYYVRIRANSSILGSSLWSATYNFVAP